MADYRLLLTGGGTGGHIYPAIEVGRLAAENGAQISYAGSERGQEGKVCANLGIEFVAFGSQPLYSLRTPRGWKSLMALLRARTAAKRYLAHHRPDVVFSTGGYSAAPLMAAARSLGVPFAIHEANSVPGRANRMFASASCFFSSVFRATERYMKGTSTVRTGQPIRSVLREAARSRGPESKYVLVFGGSQGSVFLNSLALKTAERMEDDYRWVLVTGPNNFSEVQKESSRLSQIDIKPFLPAEDMAVQLQKASVVLSRSGGSLAEIAMFGIPSVQVPLPTSADNHQFVNASEFVDMAAATVVKQSSTIASDTAADLAAKAIEYWMTDFAARARAIQSMAEWDCPNATLDIVERLEGVVKSHA
jgi:UDP-N-acetylglucosamine--N-acetylmuramyl-(pentapeptide) pyrophosphoryl-undecaprenol N-acetylglucosamine transferase